MPFIKSSVFQNKKLIGVVIAVFELAALGLVIYLAVLPLYPVLKYNFYYDTPQVAADAKAVDKAKEQVAGIKSNFPESGYAVSPNRLIISKIGVNAPIVEAKSADYGLSKGAWRLPESSTPERGGNTVITGHRFKYLPPNNLTFYLFDKLAAGDIISVIWQEKDYYYRVKQTKIVPATQLSILEPSATPILTLFTCHPLFSTEKRLVVIAEPADMDE